METEARRRPDPHSYFEEGGPVVKHLRWDVQVDFKSRQLICTAELTFNHGGTITLDTRDLTIEKVTNKVGKPLPYHLHAAEPILGSRLTIELPPLWTNVLITYRTSPKASGLMWMTPEQTAGGRHPFMFSQGEMLNTRSFLPCQDTPGVRFTYEASITVPRQLRGLSAARFLYKEIRRDSVIENWQMDMAVPSYLVAFAVGDLASREIGPRSCVWAEPELVAQAAAEFAEVPRIMDEAEKLWGPYEWGRFDLLFLPRSFPYGGMENPMLTFLSPSLVVGDKSMVYVVAHELTHAWFGNSVTNAAWDHFWMNEGWTTKGERRLSEVLFGIPQTRLEAALLEREFRRDCARFTEEGTPELTRLLTDLRGMDPDEKFSRVPYHKGAWFLEVLEKAIGREQFDAFVIKYLAHFKFHSTTTAEFLAFFEAEFPGVLESVHADEWINGEGVPESAPPIQSELMNEALRYTAEATVPNPEVASEWIAPHVALYLELFPRDRATPEVCRTIKERFGLEPRGSSDVQWTWLLLAVESGNYALVAEHLETFLGGVGRVKYLNPLYLALVRAGLVEKARELYARFKRGYHPIAQMTIEGILKAA